MPTIDKQLRDLGVDVDRLDPDVLDALRNAAPATISRDDLSTMTPEAIQQARRAGRLDHLVGGTDNR